MVGRCPGACTTAATARPGLQIWVPLGGRCNPIPSRARTATPPDAPPLGPGKAAAQTDCHPLRFAHAEAAGMASCVSQVSWAKIMCARVVIKRRCSARQPVGLVASIRRAKVSPSSSPGSAGTGLVS